MSIDGYFYKGIWVPTHSIVYFRDSDGGWKEMNCVEKVEFKLK